MASTAQQLNVPFFKKKGKGRPTTTRKRSVSPTVSSTAAPPKSEVVVPAKKGTSNLLSAGTKRTTSQRDDLDDSPQKDGPDVKWTAAGSHANAALEIIAGDEVEELLAKKRKRERQEAGLDNQEVPDDGQYHGQASYKHLVKKDAEVSKAKRAGPQRSTNTIRTVTIVDYQPDVCKDYKGSYSSSCLYVHYLTISLQKLVIVDSVTRVNSFTIVELVSLVCECPWLMNNSNSFASKILQAGNWTNWQKILRSESRMFRMTMMTMIFLSLASSVENITQNLL